MYNLIVAGHEGAWGGSPYRLERGRFGEYTDNAIAAKYKSLAPTAIAELQSLPTLFAYEHAHNADARIGFLQRVTSRSDQVQIDYAFYPDLPPIPASQLAALAWELDIAKYEMNRTHWAVKAVDLLSTLAEAGVVTRDQLQHLPEHVVKAPVLGARTHVLVAPAVFSIPHEQPEDDLVSVMMPFDAAFTPVYVAIQRSCADAGLRSLRVNDIWEEAAIIQDVFGLLFRSRIVVADFSGRNPNVMYETGIAHTLGRPVIPLSQSFDDVPFDLRHHRVLKYFPNTEGLAAMQAALTERLTTLSRRTRPLS
jgi:hypothetical protein